ncbi:nucleoside triphosphate pyrophosphohydrolase [Bacillus sp. FJAT-44742]|uniref:nucleoside triphosphate pyrophosphohydrolase n=1 Tax=Bacillus sp. FJAT-44742 TaxID=2014005 RepID=UPI000C24562D|nr:nucleoside triphosphate pyrophosphohydrolase [Bacillus sp. FJAT-44742]
MTSKKISIVGLGPAGIEFLPLGAYRFIKKQEKVYARTIDHPAVKDLQEESIAIDSFDYLYEKHGNFEDVYKEIVERLSEEARSKNVCYVVPGHPMVAEMTVQLLIEKEAKGEVSIEFKGGASFLDPMFQALQIDPSDGFQLLDATELGKENMNVRQHMIITQLYDPLIASEVKLTLMEKVPDDYEIKLVTAAGSTKERVETLPLYELDRKAEISNLTALYIPPVKEEALLYQDFNTLRQVIAELRGPNGCPWDKKQTHQSLKKYLLEEAYEVLDAIDEEDDWHLQEELGDVLLQVMLHAQIGEDEGYFTIDDVIETITEKMIRRHPHVFGEEQAEIADEVVTNWDAIKKEEKKSKGEDTETSSILSSIPVSLPSLMRAFDLQKQAAKVGFDWGEAEPVWAKLQEEIEEIKAEIQQADKEAMKKEFGDLLFVLVNLGRHYGLHPEESLHMTNQKFQRRFAYIEKRVREEKKNLEDMKLEEMDALWEEAKRKERES